MPHSTTDTSQVITNTETAVFPEWTDDGMQSDWLNTTGFTNQQSDTWTTETLALIILYSGVFLIGFTANVLVISALTTQSSRIRNNLMLSLCASDLFVCCVSMPVSISTILVRFWTLGLLTCKIAFYLQSLPVAASTLSLMMLAVDRYAAVKHPRLLSKLRPQTNLTMCMIITVWSGAALVTLPLIYVRTTSATFRCQENWPSHQLKTAYTMTHIAVVYLIPCLTVAACHFSVGHKLCTSSLAAAAVAQGALPLPMPLLRKPKNVIIVASVVHDGPSKVVPYRGEDDESSSDEAAQYQLRNDLMNLSKRPKLLAGRQNISIRSKTERNIINENRKQRKAGKTKEKPKPPLVKQMSRQSLNSRRRLANMLVAMVVVFAVCWAPYVGFKIYTEFRMTEVDLLPFCLLLGHTHSAINPLVYWLSNRQSLHIPTCGLGCLCKRDGVISRKFNRLRFPHRRPPPSSTNEAALGPFHPYYTNRKPRPPPRRTCTNDFL